jgi:hypothetical protein
MSWLLRMGGPGDPGAVAIIQSGIKVPLLMKGVD